MTYSGQAISGDSRFIKRIKQGVFNGRVHSIFDRIFNIQSMDQGELFTIANESLDNGPNTLVTEFARFSDKQIAVYDPVCTTNNTLCILNKIEIKLDVVKIWNSNLPHYPSNEQRLRRNLVVARLFIEQYGKDGGMKRSPVGGKSFDQEVSRLLAERSGLLLQAISSGNMQEAAREASGLVGLGVGLTPSGDDFLVGLFAVFNMPQSPLYHSRTFCEQVASESAGRTNEISYITLKKASTGQVRESLIQLLRDLTVGSEGSVKASLSSVLNIGSTSGTDIATGILSGLGLSVQKKKLEVSYVDKNCY